MRFVMMHFQIRLHHLIDVEGIHAAGHRHPQRVAQVVLSMMVLEELRVFWKNLALRWAVDLLFEFRRSILAGMAEEFVEHFQVLDIGGLRVGITADHTYQALCDSNQDRQRVRDNHGPDGRPKYDYQLRRLNQNHKISMFHKVAADDGAQNQKNSSD